MQQTAPGWPPPPPETDPSGAYDPRFAAVTDGAATMPVLPTLLLLTTAVLSAMILKLSGGVLPTVSLQQVWIAAYLSWGVAAVMLCIRAHEASPVAPRARSVMIAAMAVFLLLFATSTAIVWLSETRGDIVDVIRQSALILYNALMFFVFAYAARRLDAERAVTVVCHVIVALCLTSILLDFSGLTFFEIYGDRYFGFLGDGVAWLLTFPLIVYFARGNFPMAAAAALGLLLTASRGPAFVAGGGLLLLVIFSPGRRLRFIVPAAAVLAVIAYNAAQFSTLLGRFGTIEIRANDRVVTSLNGLRVFEDSPIYGGGYGSLAYYFPAFRESKLFGERSVAVSSFVQMLSDGGLLAFCGYLAVILSVTITAVALMRRGWQWPGHQWTTALGAWLLAFLWLNQSATWMLVGSYLAPIVFGVAGLVAGADLRDRDALWPWLPAPASPHG